MKVTAASLGGKKRRGEKIVMLTAYDYPMASYIDQAGADIILVSDAVGTVGDGRTEAISVTLEEMIYHARAVHSGASWCMVVVTLPFGSTNSVSEAVQNATRLVKEGLADGVHVEGTCQEAPLVRAIVEVGIPVMAHVGVTKQKILRAGRIRLPAQTAVAAAEVIGDAVAMAKAGAFAIVLECIPDRISEIITRGLAIPTIGIGSGLACDGQALVTQDMLGLYKELSPRFLKVYADVAGTIVAALSQFREEVTVGAFPGLEHSYSIDEEELSKLLSRLRAPQSAGGLDVS